MKRVVLLSGDTKLIREMRQWITETLDPNDKVVVQTYEAYEKFQELIGSVPNHSQNENGNTQGAEANAEASSDSAHVVHARVPVDLMVIDLEILAQNIDILNWTKSTRKLMLENGLASSEAPLRLIYLSYPESGFEIDRFRSDDIDDLILKPLDKALFQQKMSIHLFPEKKSKKSFLFQQKTNIEIEMGKDSWIEAVSEYGFSIRNPALLSAGVFARVYSPAFGDGVDAGLIGRVYKSEKHPTISNQFLCFLTYYGITHEQLSHVRRLIRKSRQSQPTHQGVLPFPVASSAPKTVAVIDLNSDARDTIKDCLESNFSNVEVHPFPSYKAFLRFCAARSPDMKIVPNNAATPKTSKPGASAKNDDREIFVENDVDLEEQLHPPPFAGNHDISFLIDIGHEELKLIEPSPQPDAVILGMTAEDLIARPTSWLDFFEEESKEDLAEFLKYLRTGQSGTLQVKMISSDQAQPVIASIKGRLERSGEQDGVTLVRLHFHALSGEEMAKETDHQLRNQRLASLKNFDAVYLDASLLGENPESSLEGLIELLKRARLLGTKEYSIHLMLDERSYRQPKDFQTKLARDFLFKPLDRKLILAKAALLLPGLLPKTSNVELSYQNIGFTGRITKEVQMKELSEFGLVVENETNLRERVFLRFFSSIFLREKGDGLLGRCLVSTKDEETGHFHCFFNFFGVSDAQLKHIRNWIREDYAIRKTKENA